MRSRRHRQSSTPTHDLIAAAGAAFVGYLLGTIPVADRVSAAATGGLVDLRRAGSGNPGGLNALRVLGHGWGVLVMTLDAAKGAVAACIGAALGAAGATALAGTAAVAGHVWPPWTGGRGGKGVATLAGAAVVVVPGAALAAAIVSVAGAVGTRHSERTMQLVVPALLTAALAWWSADLPPAWGPDAGLATTLFAAGGGALVLVAFRRSGRRRPI